MTYDLAGKHALVTGGASFIGSHLVEKLVREKGCRVTVLDDLSSGRIENLVSVTDDITLLTGTLRNSDDIMDAIRGVNCVFHLAADHGGRGYVDMHQVACANNMWIDHELFAACHAFGVEKIVFASSGCVYPNHLQTNTNEQLYLTEDKVGPPYDADNMYGWAKLMAEMTLRHYAVETQMETASARYFTVYGPRGKVDHAIIAILARAFIKQNPFEVWGDGTQIRNWTFVDDIVEGTIRLAEEISDGSAVNLGTMERNTVDDAVRIACDLAGYEPTLNYRRDMPTGPVNRVADNEVAFEVLDWVPQVELEVGMNLTWEWMQNHWSPGQVETLLAHGLTER